MGRAQFPFMEFKDISDLGRTKSNRSTGPSRYPGVLLGHWLPRSISIAMAFLVWIARCNVARINESVLSSIVRRSVRTLVESLMITKSE